jgi:predicted transcriptional regulator
MFKEIILENSRRKKIYGLLKKFPGLYFREIHRRLNIPSYSLEHHLSYMTRNNVIYNRKDGGYTRYFCDPLSKDEQKIISALRHKRLREIVTILIEEEEVKYHDLREFLQLSPSILSYYLKCLIDNKIVTRKKVGYENIYSLYDQRAKKVIIAYEPRFFSKLAEKAISTFMETEFKKRRKENPKLI